MGMTFSDQPKVRGGTLHVMTLGGTVSVRLEPDKTIAQMAKVVCDALRAAGVGCSRRHGVITIPQRSVGPAGKKRRKRGR